MMQDLPFFCSSAPSPVTGVGGGALNDMSIGDLSVVNSPLAISIEVRSSALGENQPPGKKREEAVDSNLLRLAIGECTSRCEELTSVLLPSLTGTKRDTAGLARFLVFTLDRKKS
jgi:hypothetical protein